VRRAETTRGSSIAPHARSAGAQRGIGAPARGFLIARARGPHAPVTNGSNSASRRDGHAAPRTRGTCAHSIRATNRSNLRADLARIVREGATGMPRAGGLARWEADALQHRKSRAPGRPRATRARTCPRGIWLHSRERARRLRRSRSRDEPPVAARPRSTTAPRGRAERARLLDPDGARVHATLRRRTRIVASGRDGRGDAGEAACSREADAPGSTRTRRAPAASRAARSGPRTTTSAALARGTREPGATRTRLIDLRARRALLDSDGTRPTVPSDETARMRELARRPRGGVAALSPGRQQAGRPEPTPNPPPSYVGVTERKVWTERLTEATRSIAAGRAASAAKPLAPKKQRFNDAGGRTRKSNTVKVAGEARDGR
jgi:hypothetical protein